MPVDISPWPLIAAHRTMGPADPLGSDNCGHPVTMTLGGQDSLRAEKACNEVMADARDAIRAGELGIRRLGDLMQYFPNVILRMPEIHEYLDHLEAHGQESALTRIVGGARRGRPRQDHRYTVKVLDRIMEVEGCSIAKAAHLAVRGRLRTLNVSAESLQAIHSRVKPTMDRWEAGTWVAGGRLASRSWQRRAPR